MSFFLPQEFSIHHPARQQPSLEPYFPHCNISLNITLTWYLLWALQPTRGLLVTYCEPWFLQVWSGGLLEMQTLRPHPRLTESESVFQQAPPGNYVRSKGWEALVSSTWTSSSQHLSLLPAEQRGWGLSASPWHAQSCSCIPAGEVVSHFPSDSKFYGRRNLIYLCYLCSTWPDGWLSVLCSEWMKERMNEWVEKHWEKYPVPPFRELRQPAEVSIMTQAKERSS